MAKARGTSYGRPMLKDLVDQAQASGLKVGFNINESGRYVLKGPGIRKDPCKAAEACNFMQGMINAATQLTPSTR